MWELGTDLMELTRALPKTAETQTRRSQKKEKVRVELGGLGEERQEQVRGRHERERGTRRTEDVND